MMKSKIVFPSVDTANEDGLLAIGGDLHISTLIEAYTHGIFPWPVNKQFPLCWFSPDPRGVIFTDQLHISKSLKKSINKYKDIDFKFNDQFDQVILACAKVVRKGQNSTWITQDIIDAYSNLFKHGLVYSLGAFRGDKLLAGVYGVQIGEFVSGESMFTLERDLSKICLVKLIQHLQARKIEFIDTQMVTPVVAGLGGVEIKRELFINKLSSLDFNSNIKLF